MPINREKQPVTTAEKWTFAGHLLTAAATLCFTISTIFKASQNFGGLPLPSWGGSHSRLGDDVLDQDPDSTYL